MPVGRGSKILESLRKPPRKRRRGASSGDEGQSTGIISEQSLQPDTPSKSFGCPYYKRNPGTYYECGRLYLSRVSYVKQHLSRKHAPRNFCPRCYEIFDAQQDLFEHQRQDPLCDPLPPRPLPFMSWEQLTNLKNRSKSALSEAQQWEEIWNLLFPGVASPASPYVDLDVPEEVNEFREYMAQEIPQMIAQRFMQGDEAYSMSREDMDKVIKDMDKVIKDIVVEVADQWIGRRRGLNLVH